jgi:7-carboxy-7-deazaguanine synthase
LESVSLKINEIFYSIQGESLLAGKPTVFVRTATCNLRCHFCDTKYSFWHGSVMTLDAIVAEIARHGTRYVCVTGGEPLGQRGTLPLLRRLVDEGYTVSLETNGSFSVEDVPRKVIKVIDLKTPGSGEAEANRWDNVARVAPHDEFKFVVTSRDDFDWAIDRVREHELTSRCHVLFSPVFARVAPAELAEWVLAARLPVTMQLQMHKTIWGERRGV